MFRSIVEVSVKPWRSTSTTISSVLKRHGGGGGRPGGKPTLNFKEKRILGVDKPYQRLKFRPTGQWSELEPFFDPSRGDFIIPLDGLEEYTEPDASYFFKNNRKMIQPSLLFGSNKSTGLLNDRRRKQPFSHSRIFGHKSANQTSTSSSA